MRLRKNKNALKILNDSNKVIHNFFDHKNKFQELFENNNPIHLEIGIGKGDFIINKAHQNPDINFVGMEKFDSVLYKAVLKAEDKIENLRFIHGDASDIDKIFGREISVLYLNFSDPWPKKRHANRRLTSSVFLEKYGDIFAKTPKIEMKTDNRNLFEYSLIKFNEHDYKIEEISLDLHNSDIINNIVTEYEEKFSKKGFPIYKVIVDKK